MLAIDEPRAIRLAILAMGGEGGGVLADWIVDLAEHGGYVAQATSVPGVAQRTGATIYYLELFPRAAAGGNGREPVLALMPVPGDVDIVIASELMEAGRAIERGLVTPERTTLITSLHRVFAMTERIASADGRVDAAALAEACRMAAKRLVACDMAAIAEAAGSVISAVMFGALARAQVLPFLREDFEATIRRSGVESAGSLRAFAAAFEQAGEALPQPAAPAAAGVGAAPTPATGASTALLDEARRFIDPLAIAIVEAGIARLIDYQDLAYARDYVERLRPIAELERRCGDGSGHLVGETARQLALGMAFEDTIRVAELKIRASRFARVAQEVGLKHGQILEIAEFLHPRLQEIAETVPAPLGRFILRTGWLRALITRATDRGKVVKTTSIRGFLLLYAVASLKSLRRRSLRHAAEQEALMAWLARLAEVATKDYSLAVELAECRNLVKGYGDTHARGSASYATIAGLIDRVATLPEPAKRLAELRKAALADDTGARLKEEVARLGLA
jgi:indolepyruvate ferredoxin oxidoreductase, beta subunit